MRHLARDGNLRLCDTLFREVSDQLLPVHEGHPVHRNADSLPNGTPKVNIGKLMDMRKPSRTEFGERLFDARVAAGLSQSEVKRKLVMAQSTLSELEKTAQGSSRVVALAQLYGVNPEWLATGKGERSAGAGSKTPEQQLRPMSAAEWKHLQAYREMSNDDRLAIDAETTKRAAHTRALWHELSAREAPIRQSAQGERLRSGGAAENLGGKPPPKPPPKRARSGRRPRSTG